MARRATEIEVCDELTERCVTNWSVTPLGDAGKSLHEIDDKQYGPTTVRDFINRGHDIGLHAKVTYA